MTRIDRLIRACCAVAALLGLSHSAIGAAPDGKPLAAAQMTISNPILFVTQVPTLADFAARGSTFANHMTRPQQVIRGGDLMIRYPNGTLRNLTQEAGFGMNGLQTANSIAVREPSVHWSGTKAIFSMLVGAPPVQYSQAVYYWQLYEVSGLGLGQTVSIVKVPNQPANYNNVSPIYGSDDRIIFTSDRPFNGQAHLYPQLDEYESTPTVTGIWSMNPATGNLRILNHTPSGAFSPSVDSFGRVVFIRWDHLQQDQQADADRGSPANPPYGSFNYADESAGAAPLNTRAEVFPETRAGSTSPAHGPVNGHTFNSFTPWQMNEDGTEEETLNHIGRHEMSFGYLVKTFASDNKLSDYSDDSLHANQLSIRMDGGLFHLREDPTQPGQFYATHTREFGTLSSGQIVRVTGAPNVNPDAMTITSQSVPFSGLASPGGRFRNTLPLSTGDLVASHTLATTANPALMNDFRLKVLNRNVSTGFLEAGATLTGGITKSVSWWDPDSMRSFSGVLWELEAVEVVARTRPTRPAPPLESPESSVFAEEGVNETAFRNWLNDNNLALIVTRNQTSRDRGDKLQPFNLRVPGGVQTVAPGGGKIYDISSFQIFQGDLIRGYEGSGRRVIGQPLHAPVAQHNVPNPGGPAGSVKIAPDGSSAAFVPARRALAWQTTDPNGEAIVRERVWVTFQPGEVRVCASCHGANTANQAQQATPMNKPEALRALLQAWKASQPSVTLTVTKTGSGTGSVTSTPAGITCGADCTENYMTGNPVTLTASPDAGAAFAGWSGVSCAGGNSGSTCAFTLNANTTVTAMFDAGSVARFDFNDDGRSDILLRNANTGENYLYPMNGTSILGTEGYIRTVPAPWVIAGVADFNGDGRADIFLRNTSTGENYLYFMNGTAITPEGYIRSVPLAWTVAGVADFDGDGKADILWRNTTNGDNYLYPMDGVNVKPTEGYVRSVPLVWAVAGVADFDGDGKADILLRHTTTGENYLYPMDGVNVKPTEGYIRTVPLAWNVAGIADFDGDGRADILLRNTSTGENYLYPMNGTAIKPTEGYIRTVPLVWSFASFGDFDGDGKADILLRNTTTGENYLYPMDGTAIKPTEGYIRSVPTNWTVMSK